MGKRSALAAPSGEPALAAWMLPPIVAAIAVSIVAGFYLGGPGLGLAVGFLAAATIVVMAIRKPPLGAIAPPLAGDLRRHLLVVLAAPLADPAAIEAVLGAVRAGAGEALAPEVLLLAPCHARFLERWTSYLEPGRPNAPSASWC